MQTFMQFLYQNDRCDAWIQPWQFCIHASCSPIQAHNALNRDAVLKGLNSLHLIAWIMCTPSIRVYRDECSTNEIIPWPSQRNSYGTLCNNRYPLLQCPHLYKGSRYTMIYHAEHNVSDVSDVWFDHISAWGSVSSQAETMIYIHSPGHPSCVAEMT